MSEHVNLQQYTDFEQATHDQTLVAEAGLDPSLHKEPDENSETGYLYVLQISEAQARPAYELLTEYYESEKDETFEIMGDWIGGPTPSDEAS